MLPFDIEKAKKGFPLIDERGNHVRIICFNRKGDEHMIGLITLNDTEYPIMIDDYGRAHDENNGYYIIGLKKEQLVISKSIKTAVTNFRLGVSYKRNDDTIKVTPTEVKWHFKDKLIVVKFINNNAIVPIRHQNVTKGMIDRYKSLGIYDYKLNK